MKKLLLASAILIAASTSSFAQKDSKEDSKPLSFSIGAEGSLPLGTFGNSYSFICISTVWNQRSRKNFWTYYATLVWNDRLSWFTPNYKISFSS